MRYSGFQEDWIDGIISGHGTMMWIDEEEPILELNRAVKMEEDYRDRIFRTTHPDFESVNVEQLMGTNIISYY